MLEEMLAPEKPIWDKADQIKEVEHKCDFLTHEIIQRLHRTFVTPLDREDIHDLARSLDDVMDAIDDSGGGSPLQHRTGPARRPRAGPHHQGLDRRDGEGVESARTRDGVAEPAVEINRLENEADRVHYAAVRRLFEEERDPIVIMKWKEILDFFEEATDRCEDVANAVEGIVVKHA